MSTGTSSGGGTGGGGVGGALSLMSCVREASPPPQNYHPHQHYHHHRTPMGFPQFAGQNNVDPLPKEPKKRRFHPLRGLRKIFRRKSRGAADACSATSGVPDRDPELTRITNEDITMRHPAGHPEEVRVRSASELLIDLCDRDSVFARRGTRDDSLTKLRGETGKLSVSHDSVFPGDVPPTRPISSLDSLVTFEVLERIKTAIENRNQLTSTVLSDNTNRNINVQHTARSTKDASTDHTSASLPKEDLPNLETASLNHTAALHRISVRPKNRRPPRRSTPTANSGESSSMNTTTTSISEDTLDNVDQHSPLPHVSNNNNNNNTQDLKIIVNVAGKSSPLQSARNSESFEESEPQLLPIRKPSSVASLSPDSLDTTSASRSSVEDQLETVKRPSIIRKPSNRGSRGSDTFEEPKPQCRRSSSNRLLPKSSPDSLDHRHPHRWFSKSTEGFENLVESDKTRPIAVKRLLLLNTPISKSTDRISKSSDSFEMIKSLGSDDSIERCRNNFEFRPRRASELISKSSENFDILEHGESVDTTQEIKRGNSISDVNNLVIRDRKSSKCNVIKSSQSAERNQISEMKNKEPIEESKGVRKTYLRRPSQRMSSESLDNLELDDRLENRRTRRPPKREFNPSQVTGILPSDDHENGCRKPPIVVRKPSSRLQTSSESSELDSTDTFDFDRRNKSSESTETLDSLEKDSEQEIVHEVGFMNNVEKSDKNDSWSSDIMATIDSDRISIADGEEDSQSFISPNKFYWRQSSDPKKNLDIHQLLAITIVTRMADNGNNDNDQQRTTSAIEPTKEQFPVSPPTSPTVTTKHEDNHLIFDHLITNKNDEDLENMLNGNISDASIDTKSFKEKLIMFEKLGK